MQEYFIVENNQQKGPFSIEELKEIEITDSTLVWKVGLESWTEAKNIEELNLILKPVPLPPPLPINKHVDKNVINVNIGFKKNEKVKNNVEKKIRSEHQKVIIAKFIKKIVRLIPFFAIIMIISWLTLSLFVYGGFSTLTYKYKLNNCKGRSDCIEVQKNIIYLGNKYSVIEEGPGHSWEIERDDDLIKSLDDYSKRNNISPDVILKSGANTYDNQYIKGTYAFISLCSYDDTIDNLISNSFGVEVLTKSFYWTLLVSFLIIGGRFTITFFLQSKKWVDINSNKNIKKNS
jgi:hypothetical protein